ncbi:hypothetical protein ABT340_15765 [Streptosporangium sp. NPDC000239]|uniref:hypothetical protein n=1 Tax=Streptosporangium sp. NPDC000239 TaxID=3154248 RepID=UPI003316DAC1
MDVTELQASLQALMNQQAAKQAPAPQPEPTPVETTDVLVAAAPDDFYERYFVPVAQPPDRSNEFDDHLLVVNEEAGDVTTTKTANAAYRAKRTGVQGLLATVLVSVGGVLGAIQLDADIDWRVLGLLVAQAVLTAIVSYLHTDKRAEDTSE